MDLDVIFADVLDQSKGSETPTGYLGEPKAPTMGNLKKLSYTHDAMIDQIIANPAVSQNQLAAMFGYSASWISNIIASDAFQARLAERSKELIDPEIRKSVEVQFKGLVLRSLEILQKKLEKPIDDIPDNLALRALEISSRAAGYGGKPEAAPMNPVNVNLHLEVLGENLVQLLNRKRSEVIEHQVDPITGP